MPQGFVSQQRSIFLSAQPSFPTRRSSDLLSGAPSEWLEPGVRSAFPSDVSLSRSEEHTSELQSREKLVCRLLLEKKHVVSRKHVMKFCCRTSTKHYTSKPA